MVTCYEHPESLYIQWVAQSVRRSWWEDADFLMWLLPFISWNMFWGNNVGGVIPFNIFHKPPSSQEYPRLSPMLRPVLSWVSNTSVLYWPWSNWLCSSHLSESIVLLWIIQLHRYSHCLKSCLREEIGVRKCYVITSEYLDGFKEIADHPILLHWI